MKKVLLGFGIFALAVASAASGYRFTLFQPSKISGQMLKAGDYKIEIKEDKAIITQGKTTTEVSVKVETADTKFSTTAVRYDGDQVKEIRLGGTSTRLVFAN
jgi:hypothetical protein